jgi:hypothetical protein
MPHFIRRRECKTEVTHHLFFQRKGETEHSGFAFVCSATGKVADDLEARVAELRVDPGYAPPVLERREHSWMEPAVIRCVCGSEVQLAHFTNTCKCERDYNSSGQLLGPRESWGEETGEHWTDCI